MHANSPESLIEVLFCELTSRQIQEGSALIDREEARLRSIRPEDVGASRSLYVLGGWGEYSKTAAEIARLLQNKYDRNPWPMASFADWGWIVGGRVLLALGDGRYADVDESWQWIQDNAGKFNPPTELLATIDLAKAHAKRKCASYPEALDLVRSAVRRYREANLPGMLAVAQALEGWLLTQLGDRQSASQSWSEAFSSLQGTEDSSLLGNIIFWRGRDRCRADFEEEGRALLLESAGLHELLQPPHRNLRHIHTDLADLELRMFSRCTDTVRAAELWKSAGGHIKQAEALLKNDDADHRNRIRLLLAQANHALLAPIPNFYIARIKAQQASKLAKKHADKLMIARALYKQAVIEKRDSENEHCTNPIRRLVNACRYAMEALDLAGELHSDRLAARIHTLLGNVFVEFPFCDPEYAAQHWDAAVERMSQHEDFDYVVSQIMELGKKLEGFQQATGKNPLIIAVSEQIAFEKGLDETSRQVERAIVLAAVEWIDPSPRIIAKTLGTGRQRIVKILDTKRSKALPPPLPTHRVIFRVNAAFAFSRPLQETIKAVERAIILATWIRYGCDRTAAKDKLHIGFDKVVSALENR
jgi:tetratricopeptide (TPR) repeat protein